MEMQRHRQRQLPAEQGARGKAASQDPGAMTQTEGRGSADYATQAPQIISLSKKVCVVYKQIFYNAS